VFDWGLDGAAWVGPGGRGDVVFGEARVGPLGLLALLETRLGLGGRFDGLLRRACRLEGRLWGMAGFWRASFELDPVGTCKRLLRDRDLLWLWGWEGQGVSQRLAELHAATAGASPGIPDRLRAVAAALVGRRAVFESLISYTNIELLAPAWRAVFQALRGGGVAVEERTLAASPAVGDLAGARTARFQPAGDGRLCLLRRHGALDLADEVAASLAAYEGLDEVVIIGADGVLDRALARHGLPRAGEDDAAPASSRLLTLVIEAAFEPMEVGDLHALLAADPGPIPRGAAGPLMRALQRFPGRRSPEWSAQLKAALDGMDEPRRTEVARRVTELLMPVCGREEKLPVADLRRRLDTLGGWARRRAAHVPSLLELGHGTEALAEAVELTGAERLSRHELRSLCEDLGESTWSWRAAQAGLAHVARPGAMLGPARAVIWWNFSRDTAPRPEHILLTRVERDGLSAIGVVPPDPSRTMALEADSWRRPLIQAREALVLACPHTDASGDDNHPHPLWDDLTASLASYQDAGKLLRTRLVHPAPAGTTVVPPRPVVAPAAAVTVASPLALSEVESPSSLEQLIACSLSWALEYRGRLRWGLSEAPARPGPLLFGVLAHRLLEQVLGREHHQPEDATALAGDLFEEQCSDLCEALALREHQAARATLRRTVVDSARELVRLALKHAARGVRAEQAGETVVQGQAIKGRLDLVWDEPAVVLDLKWGKRSSAERLKSGTALQLAAYGAIRAVDGRPAETAYFSLLTQDVLAEPGGRLAVDACMQGAYRSSDTWSAALVTVQQRRESLARGQLEAPGAVDEEVKPAYAPTGLRLGLPCRYCSFGGLCGREGAR
jgi:ATP-dependent helicase/nuclease subunit B